MTHARRGYSIFANRHDRTPESQVPELEAYLTAATPEPVHIDVVSAFLDAAGNGAWRLAAQIAGAVYAHATNGVEALTASLDAAKSRVHVECHVELAEAAHEAALMEALRAWRWVPRNQWSTAHEHRPWLGQAHSWLARRTPEALDQLHTIASLVLEDAASPMAHDVLCALLAGIEDEDIPEAHRDRIARVMREKLVAMHRAYAEGSKGTIDDAFLGELEIVGDSGKAHAKALREGLAKSIEEFGTPNYGWLPSTNPVSPPRRLETLAVVIWRDVVEPEVERASRARQPRASAMPLTFVKDLAAIATASKLGRDANNATLIATRADGNDLVTNLLLTSVAAMQSLALEHALATSNSPYFWQVIEWITRTVSTQEMSGMQDPHFIRVEGGDNGLRLAMGIAKKDASAEIGKILDFLHLLGSASAPGQGRALSVIRHKSKPPGGMGAPRVTTIIEVHSLMRSKKSRELGLPNLWDIAIFPTHLLITVGDHRTKARQLNAMQALALHAHAHRLDIATDGSFPLSLRQWEEHSAKYGMYHRTHGSLRNTLLDAMQTEQKQRRLPIDREGNEPLLVRVAPDRYRLGDTFEPEWDHFIEQGVYSLAQSDRARASIEKRAKERDRVVSGRKRSR